MEWLWPFYWLKRIHHFHWQRSMNCQLRTTQIDMFLSPSNCSWYPVTASTCQEEPWRQHRTSQCRTTPKRRGYRAWPYALIPAIINRMAYRRFSTWRNILLASRITATSTLHSRRRWTHTHPHTHQRFITHTQTCRHTHLYTHTQAHTHTRKTLYREGMILDIIHQFAMICIVYAFFHTTLRPDSFIKTLGFNRLHQDRDKKVSTVALWILRYDVSCIMCCYELNSPLSSVCYCVCTFFS